MPIQTRPNWTQLANRPTTIAGFGITDVNWSNVASKPTTVGGFGITDANPRAWVNFDGRGTVAIRASGNVSSITDVGVGDYTVNLTTAMPDSLGACTVSGIGLLDNTAASRNNMYGGYITTSSEVRVSCWDISNAAEDPAVMSVTISR